MARTIKLAPDELLSRAEEFIAHAKDEAKSDRPADIQDAASKAWLSTRQVARAMVACRRQEWPRGTKKLLDTLDEIKPLPGRPDPEGVGSLVADIGALQRDLHHECEEQSGCAAAFVRRRIERIEKTVIPAARKMCHRG